MTHSSKVTVCRGCCCGTAEKHPEVDHARQLRRLRESVGIGQLTVANCLNSCSRSNVVVVRPGQDSRRAGAQPVWFGGVLTEDAVDDIVAWIGAGGPGRAEMPGRLADYVIESPADSAAG